MGLLDDFFDALCEDWDDEDWNTRTRTVPGSSGKHRYVVNYVSTNGTPCGVEVLAYTNGQARDSVSCRSDVKYVTSSYEVY